MKTSNRHDNLKLTGDHRNQCPSCHEYFNSIYAFDKHRQGPWTDRKCLPPHTIGMSLNPAGFWISRAREV